MATNLPTNDALTALTVTRDQFRDEINNQRDFLAGLIGTDGNTISLSKGENYELNNNSTTLDFTNYPGTYINVQNVNAVGVTPTPPNISTWDLPNDQLRILRFGSEVVLKHTTSALLPGGVDIHAVAGDIAVCYGVGTGHGIRILSYTRADGTALNANYEDNHLVGTTEIDRLKVNDSITLGIASLTITQNGPIDFTNVNGPYVYLTNAEDSVHGGVSNEVHEISEFTMPTGRLQIVRFASDAVLVNSADKIRLPGGENISVEAGDIGTFICVSGTDKIRCISYTRANGMALVENQEIDIPGGSITAGNITGDYVTVNNSLNLGKAEDILIFDDGYVDLGEIEGIYVNVKNGEDSALGAALDDVHTISGFSMYTGGIQIVRFASAAILHNGSGMVLPGEADIAVQAGDIGTFYCVQESHQIRCISYTRADGTAIVGGSAGPVQNSQNVENYVITLADTAPSTHLFNAYTAGATFSFDSEVVYPIGSVVTIVAGGAVTLLSEIAGDHFVTPGEMIPVNSIDIPPLEMAVALMIATDTWLVTVSSQSDGGSVGGAPLANPTFTGNLTVDGSLIQKYNTAINSAATLDLSSIDGNFVTVNGTTNITAVTLTKGKQVVVKFQSALTITGSSSLELPGANIVTESGDIATFVGAPTSTRCIAYVRDSGRVMHLDLPQNWSARQSSVPHPVPTDVASLVLSPDTSNVFTIALTTMNCTVPNQTGMTPGTSITLLISQGATPRTLGFGTNWHFPGGTLPTITQTANATDVIAGIVRSSTVIDCVATLNTKTA